MYRKLRWDLIVMPCMTNQIAVQIWIVVNIVPPGAKSVCQKCGTITDIVYVYIFFKIPWHLKQQFVWQNGYIDDKATVKWLTAQFSKGISVGWKCYLLWNIQHLIILCICRTLFIWNEISCSFDFIDTATSSTKSNFVIVQSKTKWTMLVDKSTVWYFQANCKCLRKCFVLLIIFVLHQSEGQWKWFYGLSLSSPR